MIVLQNNKVAEGSMRALSQEIRKDLYGGGQVSDDVRLSLRGIESQIKRFYDEVVTEFDRREFREGITPDERRMVSYECLELKPTSAIDCKCSSVSWDVLEVDLPRLYYFRGQPFISYFGFSNREVPFVKVNSISALNNHHRLSAKPAYLIQGNKAYAVRPSRYALFCQVSIVGIPECPHCTQTGHCFDVWSSDWKVSPYIKNEIKRRILAQWGKVVTETAPLRDVRNDGADGNAKVPLLVQ